MNQIPLEAKVIGGCILLLITVGVLLAIAPFITVDAGERVVVTRVGKVDRVLENGFHWINPFLEDTYTYDVRTQAHKVSASAASSDLQSVSAEVTVNYVLNSNRVGEIYAQLGSDAKVLLAKVMDPSVQEAVKSSTAKYTAEQLIGKREQVKGEINRLLVENVEKKALGLVMVTDVSITNFDFSKSFNEAIELKVKAEQEALTAKNQLEQVKYEAEQRVAKAEAEAKSIRLQSDAANNPRFVELKQLEVQLEFAKKWNGVLPVNLYGSAPIPFLQLSN